MEAIPVRSLANSNFAFDICENFSYCDIDAENIRGFLYLCFTRSLPADRNICLFIQILRRSLSLLIYFNFTLNIGSLESASEKVVFF